MERRRAKFAPKKLLFDDDDETQTDQNNSSIPSLASSSFLSQSPTPATPGLSSFSSSVDSPQPQSQFQTPDSSNSSHHRSMCPPTPTPARSYARSTPNYRTLKTESPAFQSLIRSALVPDSPEVEMRDLGGRDHGYKEGHLNFDTTPAIMLTPAGVLNSPKKFHSTSPRTWRATSAPPSALNINLFPGPGSASSVQLKNNVNPFSPDHRHVRPHVTVPMEPNTTMSRYLQDFDEMTVLSKGRYSTVCKSFSRVDGCFYAIKKVKFRTSREKECFLQEVYALAAIRDHSHIMRYSTAWIDEEDRTIYIQAEYCSGGSLAQFVEPTTNFANGHPSTPNVHLAAQRRMSNPQEEHKYGMNEKELCIMINQISKALDYLHHREMVHFDIKPDNIFISPSTDKTTSSSGADEFAKPHDQPSLLKPCYKLGDLGLVSDIRAKSVDYNEGDNKYLSRELLDFEGSDNWQKRLQLPKSDIFSLGCTAYELARGFALPQSGDEYDAIRRAEISLDQSKFSREFLDLLKLMLNPDPSKRPSARELLSHPLIGDTATDNCDLKARVMALEEEIQELKTKQQQREFKLRRQSFSPAGPKSRSKRSVWGEDELEISLSRTLGKYGKELDHELVKTIAHEIRIQMETNRHRHHPYNNTAADLNGSYYRNYISIHESYDGDVDESRCNSSVDAAMSQQQPLKNNSAETLDVPRIVLTPAMSQ